MGDKDLLVLYSEWLDGQNLVADPDESGDYRTHTDLVADFLAERAGQAVEL